MNLNLDKNGYLLSVSTTPTGGPKVNDLSGYDLSGHRLQAHRWDGERLVLDEDRLKKLEAARLEAENAASVIALQKELTESNAIVLEALEALFGARDITEFMTALHKAKTELADTLAERSATRKKIQYYKGDMT